MFKPNVLLMVVLAGVLGACGGSGGQSAGADSSGSSAVASPPVVPPVATPPVVPPAVAPAVVPPVVMPPVVPPAVTPPAVPPVVTPPVLPPPVIPPVINSVGQGFTPADLNPAINGNVAIPFSSAATCTPIAGGRDFPINGPGSALTKLSDVDWNNLKAGDTVRIFYKSTSYAEKITIKGQGTAALPIVICGVPGPGGALPVISGRNATTPSTTSVGSQVFNDNLTTGGATADNGVLESLGVVSIHDPTYQLKPTHIHIEGLKIQDTLGAPGATANVYPFTNKKGTSHFYNPFAACIRVQKGDDIVIRGNDLTNCGHGLFVMSKQDNEASVTRRILIEGNYLHGNSITDQETIHNAYVQGIGVMVQFNYFGPNRPGAIGSNYKDRSVGLIARYNYFENGARIMDLVGVEDYPSILGRQGYQQLIVAQHLAGNLLTTPVPTNADLALISPEQAFRNYWQIQGLTPAQLDSTLQSTVAQAEQLYKNTYVYGNIFKNTGPGTGGALSLIHFGGDKYPYDLTRVGTLYFYHNTIALVSQNPTTPGDAFGALELFDQSCGNDTGCPSNGANVVAVNNIFDSVTDHIGVPAIDIAMTRLTSDVVNLGKNWVPAAVKIVNARPFGTAGGTVNGKANLVQGASPGFNASYRPSAPTILGQAADLPAAIALFPPLFLIDPAARSVAPRASTQSHRNIGAVD